MLSRLILLSLAAFMAAAAGAAAPASAQSAAATPAFLSAIDDVPLMPGLTERRDQTLVFDKPEGRIVESIAEGRLSRAQVLKFYAATLPQLGWKPRGEGRFLREDEELMLSFAGGGGNSLTVHFALSPNR